MIYQKPTMNEETDTPETLADIIAEMRRFAAFAAGRSRITPAPSLAAEQECHAAKLTKYADRIETAYKREHAEWHGETNAAKEERNRIACKMRYEFAAKCRACKATPGNAAALREALENVERVARFCAEAPRHTPAYPTDAARADVLYSRIAELGRVARAALAAPARNCDRFATAEEAMREFDAMCDQTPYCRGDECVAGKYRRTGSGGIGCVPGWLFAPAEGGAK